jgi:hypothetical protein
MNTFSTLAGKGIALLVLLAVVLGGAFYFTEYKESSPTPVACTLEAMQCPDGSYVGRTGPNCQFVCPPVATTTAPAPKPTTGGTTGGSGNGTGGIAPFHSGIRGTVMAGPTCPVMRNPPDPACADKPLQITVTVYHKGDTTHAFATAQSDSKGAFEFSIPPGEYIVGAGGKAMLPRCNQTPATVGAQGYTSIVVECDTGIR